MASIRNLEGGGGNRRRARSHTYDDGNLTSSLSARTWNLGGSATTDGGGGRPPRRTMPFGSSQHHVLAGEVMSSYHQPGGQGLSSWGRPRYHVASGYNLSDVSDRNVMAPPPPPTATPSPPSGRFRKLRSSTWDSAGMGRLSPKLMLSRSGSHDHSPTSDGTGKPGGDIHQTQRGDLPKAFFEDSEADLGTSDSESGEEESKREEDEDVGESANEDADWKDSIHTPRSDAGSESGSSKGIFRSNSQSTLKSEAKSVTFAEEVRESLQELQEGSPSSRPGFCAKLPSLTHWEKKIDEGDESVGSSLGIGSPTSPGRSKALERPFQRQNSQSAPGLLAKLNPFGDLSWSLVGSCIVRTAPCFWCSRKLGISATDREILMRLNVLCAFFCVVQIGSGIFLFVIKVLGFVEDDENDLASQSSQQDQDKPLVTADLWDLELFVYCLSVINLVLLIASMFARRAIRDVNLVGSVRFMWVLFWLLPIQVFFMIGLFDYYYVNEVKTKHWWDDPSMRQPREIFCYPGTANDQCKVPILGGIDYPTEEAWCFEKYNQTNCEEIRDEAQREYSLTSRTFYTVNGIWALLLVVIMWTTLNVLQAIITLPIVQRSKESNIPLWLTFPIIGCFTVGYLLHYSQTSVTEDLQDVYWIALAYLISGGAFALAAMIGIFLKCYTVLNGRQRRIKQGVVILFNATIILTVFSAATIFITSLIYSLNIVDLPLEEHQTIACSLDMSGSCTGCDRDDLLLMCPEWTEDDVNTVLQTVLKQSATLAAIFLVYALITLRYGFVLFRYVSRYQIEYV